MGKQSKRDRHKNHHKPERAPERAAPLPDNSRRKFMLLGLGTLGALGAGAALAYESGLFAQKTSASNTATTQPAAPPFKPFPPLNLSANYANALRAAEEITAHYTRELLTPWAIIHAVRGFGRAFK